ncbi:MAG: hemolysin family protein [Opitutaceae bacterium]|nr:hemolysin family protein [Opitutaceae bacterium]
MFWLVFTIICTLGVSFACSLSEAVILSTTVAEIEALKHSRPKHGLLLEALKLGLEDTMTAILTLNTIANTLGSMIIGGLVTHLYGETMLGVASGVMTFAILVFSEVLPKNIGVAYREALQPHVVHPLWWVRRALAPILYVSSLVVRLFIKGRPPAQASDREIILLAEKGAQEGTLTPSESSIIANALSLDDVRVGEIMTPRTVVTTLRKNATVGEVFGEFPNIPFARIPVSQKNLDDIVGLVRRRDLLKAKANDQDLETVGNLMQEISFIPETATVGNALQLFLKTHQQLLVVVDEFGSTAGVVTMEDVMEHILGREIFEKDDVAVDMRELARAKLQKQGRIRRPGDPSAAPWPPKT